ncbi:hypothetical protein EVAR_57822_1 [Eumeta japonica]|uniref:Uncharacterized protein n=1 Tax=Eumeta variegata TaxID=151549 RepID=A0A4C1ZV96_EUMVA|nr:hypothetical protein EVAR_57822_1 [Eumeta japonica]
MALSRLLPVWGDRRPTKYKGQFCASLNFDGVCPACRTRLVNSFVDLLPLETRLEITVRETLHALRATLLHTHWHTFTLLAEQDIYLTLSLHKDLSAILTAQPLNPKWLSLPLKYSRHALFRTLAEISRLTRGVVVLICDIHYAKLVMDEAKRLNMLDGHFFWLWIDATKKIDVFHNIRNRTQEDNDQDVEPFWDRDDALVEDSHGRSKRNDDSVTDNNSVKNFQTSLHNTSNTHIPNNTAPESDESSLLTRNSNINDTLINNTNKITSKTEAYRSNNKSYIKFMQSYDTSRHINYENFSKYNDVNNEGVETSKIEMNSTETKENSSSLSDNSRRFSNTEMMHESFNKYVNSIELREEQQSIDVFSHEVNNLSIREMSSNVNREILSSGLNDFLMNPAVQKSNVRNNPEKRGDRYFIKDKNVKDNVDNQLVDNVTVIFNNFPVGLLALRPQPTSIDIAFVRAALRLAVGALRRVLHACDAWSAQAQFFSDAAASCWDEPSDAAADFSAEFVR